MPSLIHKSLCNTATSQTCNVIYCNIYTFTVYKSFLYAVYEKRLFCLRAFQFSITSYEGHNKWLNQNISLISLPSTVLCLKCFSFAKHWCPMVMMMMLLKSEPRACFRSGKVCDTRWKQANYWLITGRCGLVVRVVVLQQEGCRFKPHSLPSACRSVLGKILNP